MSHCKVNSIEANFKESLEELKTFYKEQTQGIDVRHSLIPWSNVMQLKIIYVRHLMEEWLKRDARAYTQSIVTKQTVRHWKTHVFSLMICVRVE